MADWVIIIGMPVAIFFGLTSIIIATLVPSTLILVIGIMLVGLGLLFLPDIFNEISDARWVRRRRDRDITRNEAWEAEH